MGLSILERQLIRMVRDLISRLSPLCSLYNSRSRKIDSVYIFIILSRMKYKSNFNIHFGKLGDVRLFEFMYAVRGSAWSMRTCQSVG